MGCTTAPGSPRRAGLTLLELILALALTVVVLAAVGMAIDVHLRSFNSRRNVLEESQLARSLLRIMANDIRSVAVQYEQDVSSVKALLQSASGGNRNGGGGGGSGGRDGGGGSAEEAAGELSAGTAADGTGSDDLLAAEPSLNTMGLADSAALPSTPGIYGNQYELQIDISRLPRIDQYQQIYTADSTTTLADIPSDIKTVTYFVQTATDRATAQNLDPLASQSEPASGAGLVRRELDRAVTRWAVYNSSATSLMQSGDLLAPEVVGVEFQYYDGIQWLTQWDTEMNEGVPLAIQIVLYMQSPAAARVAADAGSLPDLDDQGIRYYRLIVHLPMAAPTTMEEEMTAAGEL